MRIYHATSYENGTKILLEKRLRTNMQGQVYFCLNHSDLERMIDWWREINFKPDIEFEVLCLEVEDTEIYPDPSTTSFDGYYAIEDLQIKE